jgi:hypothetical protein
MIRATQDFDPLDLLDHAEAILENYVPSVDKVSIEDKILLSHEEDNWGLSPWEVQEVVQEAMSQLPDGLEEHVDLIFDVIYEAIAEALDRARR